MEVTMFEQLRNDDEMRQFGQGKPFRVSPLWDLCVPFVIAAIPAGLFVLLGFIASGLDRPGAKLSFLVIVLMGVLQSLGIIAMAVVILMRYRFGLRELAMRTSGNLPIWRRLMLLCSLAFVLLFDAFTNVAAAFEGAGFLLLPAAPAFIGYIICVRIAFARL